MPPAAPDSIEAAMRAAGDGEEHPMEAQRLRTIDDLLAWPDDERVELIDGQK
ncbi:MAG: hypothetical protein VBE63_01230 [Lamprobacter sp.]|uniref:hypothetical protein n=1 Tax=Lamprobacter sp. TaxID=3100796 RepID=UPI002B25C289|nr:hypothetical protein [Lamprobacter sp.]MEA3638549.1 hypothetical protein [Lamprobacter sp.]